MLAILTSDKGSRATTIGALDFRFRSRSSWRLCSLRLQGYKIHEDGLSFLHKTTCLIEGLHESPSANDVHTITLTGAAWMRLVSLPCHLGWRQPWQAACGRVPPPCRGAAFVGRTDPPLFLLYAPEHERAKQIFISCLWHATAAGQDIPYSFGHDL